MSYLYLLTQANYVDNLILFLRIKNKYQSLLNVMQRRVISATMLRMVAIRFRDRKGGLPRRGEHATNDIIVISPSNAAEGCIHKSRNDIRKEGRKMLLLYDAEGQGQRLKSLLQGHGCSSVEFFFGKTKIFIAG